MPFKPGQSGNPAGKPKGIRNRATLDKEARRILFEQIVSDKFEELVGDAKPEYLLDQFMGKAPDTLNINGVELFLGKKPEKKDES